MSISKIQIISNAFVLLGGSSIAALDENSTEARIASSLYDTTYTTLITQHRWRFSIKQATLARLAENPLYEYSYAFRLPTDLLYLVKLDTRTAYQIYGTNLYADVQELKADYQYTPDEFDLPAYFLKAFGYILASQFAIPLTGDIEKASYYSQVGAKELIRAKFADSTQTPTHSFASDTYASVRN